MANRTQTHEGPASPSETSMLHNANCTTSIRDAFRDGMAGSYRIVTEPRTALSVHSAPTLPSPPFARAVPMNEAGHPPSYAPVSRVTRSAEGDVLAGKYRLFEPICEGGMGTVYRARCLESGADVAVKLMRDDAGVPHAVERMMEEARAAARLRHPSVVRVLDFGETDRGVPFLVMELLAGLSLAEELAQRGPMSPLESVRTLLPIASALAMAHARGVIHRDVKPDNIVLAKAGPTGCTPKLIDFGVVKVVPGSGPRLTSAGTVVGSPDYMAPEHIMGKSGVDERIDVWALSMVLYEMLNGAPAYAAPNVFTVLYAIASPAPLPETSLAKAEPELWAILARGLAKDPDERFRSMRALGRALSTWAVARGAPTDIAGNSLASQWLTAT